MTKFNKTLLALAASSALAVSANAEVGYGANGTGQPYVGVKVGQIDAEQTGVSLDKAATAYGVYGGYNFNKNIGIEAEYLRSGKAKTTNALSGLKGEYDAKTYGVYGTYRHHFADGPIYAKGRLGLAKTQVEGNAGSTKFSKDQISVAGGVGLGFQATQNFGIEAGYNYLNSDASTWGVGAHISF